MGAAQSVGAAQGGKPSAVAAAALRTVFACLSQQAARGGAAALAGVPAHVRDSLSRDFSAAGPPARPPHPPSPRTAHPACCSCSVSAAGPSHATVLVS